MVETEAVKQAAVINAAHVDDSTGKHRSIEQTSFAITERYFWEDLYRSVSEELSRCRICNLDLRDDHASGGVWSEVGHIRGLR